MKRSVSDKVAKNLGRLYLRLRGLLWRIQGKILLSQVDRRGSSCRFEGGGVILEPENMEIGDHVFLGRNAFIRCAGGLKIGSYSHISRNVSIHTANHNSDGELLPYDRTLIKKAVHIGKYVWIGMNVSITPGVSIGDGAIIGMGTVVSNDVPAGAVVVGTGSRVVKYRDALRTTDLVNQHKFLTLSNPE